MIKTIFLFQVLTAAHCLKNLKKAVLYLSNGHKKYIRESDVNCLESDSDICLINTTDIIDIEPLQLDCPNDVNKNRVYAIGLDETTAVDSKHFYDNVLKARANVVGIEKCRSKPNIICVTFKRGGAVSSDGDSGKERSISTI